MTDILHTITAGRRQKRLLLALSFFIFHFSFSLAQIKVGGNVYGGGNEGYVGGSATVTVRSGNLNKVFGGARMANVGGNTYVNVDGEHASGYMVINYVFGGNDIAGTIGTAKAVGEEMPSELVDEDLKESTDNGLDNLWKADRRVDDTWNSYVHISSKTNPDGTVSNDNEKVFIGQVYAGGNGDYSYTPTGDSSDADVDVKDDDGSTVATLPYNFNMPHLDKTFLDVQGGSVAFAYGGGNAVTVREKAVIHVDNPSEVVTHLFVNKVTQLEDQTATEEGENVEELLTDERIKQDMGINMTQEHISSADFQIGRFFGGNNKAEMAIQPTWNLQRGKIRNLYSGGNEGDMTHPVGLLLDIDPFEKYKDLLVINNVYGGCRKADIHPLNPDRTSPEPWEIQLSSTLTNKSGESYRFPEGLPARTLVRGGKVTNVYGGNDISGHVYGGNAVGIYTSILGDVYGGGNGSYAYTDKVDLSEIDDYKDFYYNPTTVLENEGIGGVLAADQSVTALNLFRPNAEQVSLRLWGKSAVEPTIIGGSVFVGGNSATLKSSKPNPMVELKIGSHVYADKVFLGNNGENMVKEEVLQKLKDINTINLEETKQFSQYMDGCAMTISPRVVFDSETNGDPKTYTPYTSYFGSFYCGGNVGSMKFHGCTTIDIAQKVIIFDKLVGGCNNAYVPEHSGFNAAYDGGLLGDSEEGTGNKLVLNLSELKLQPKRWKNPDDKSQLLEWNTWNDAYYLMVEGTELETGTTYYIKNEENGEYVEYTGSAASSNGSIYKKVYEHSDCGTGNGPATAADKSRRLVGGNVYGGCCESGHVEGNVVININGTIVDREGEYGVFDSATPTDGDPDILYDHENYTITERRSGVILGEQGMDVLGEALSVFGGGKGKGTEIWGSATVNINKGYCFQVFGGSESGVIGKPSESGDYTFNNKKYTYNPAYSTYVNLNYNSTSGTSQGRPREVNNPDDDMADVEFIYGGSFEGPIIGNTIARLDNGRLFNLFAGSCNADILGHTETYVGENGFPWLRDHIYGGNDLGGEIKGVADFTSRLREGTMVHDASLLKANSYVEYRKGHTNSIFGGCFGDYDYNTEFKKVDGYDIPLLQKAFVNIRPDYNSSNTIEKVFGAGEGCPGVREGDKSQDCSYVLIDIEDTDKSFTGTEVFGAGSNNGLGMGFAPDDTFEPDFGNKATAVIDLLHGEISNVYGGSYNEGVTRRTMVNVPAESTIRLQNIFGGAYGTQILPPCDVYESNVNYNNTSENARLTGAIYGGNNNQRRTLYTRVNISSPVWQSDEKTFTANVFGAGRGVNTWSEYTEVNLESGARVYKTFGGGEEGHVLNAASVQSYMKLFEGGPSPEILAEDPKWENSTDDWASAWKDAWTLGSYYTPNGDWDDYAGNEKTNMSRLSDRPELTDQIASQLDGAKKHNTNVIIKEGAVVDGYAYGGGLGNASIPLSGDVYGTTYIALLGGIVSKDIYAAGQTGALDNLFGATNFGNNEGFIATANAYIQGGMVRNVYGGGYEGHVGYHDGDLTTDSSGDRLAKSYVVIGKAGSGTTFYDGVPAILRNAYGGGEGGSVYGDTKVTLNNGYIGYRYKNIGTDQDPVYAYVEELDDQKPNAIELAGNVFGGGYVVNSYVDNAQIDLYGGIVRGCVYGGGEVGPIGRGTMKSGSYTGGHVIQNGDAYIFKGGKTQVNMYDGHVLRNVFGGGRGHDSWGGDGTMYMKPEVVAQLDMKCKGYVFGQTEVNIHGGEIGTAEGMEQGFGNVFGGGNEGSVYSATGQKSGYDNDKEGYYYNNEDKLTEDCKVLVEPWLQVKNTSVTYDNKTYNVGDYVPISYLNTLGKKDKESGIWPIEWDNLDAGSLNSDNNYTERGVIIHNAVFAGGNTTIGSDLFANTKTVFGNATATIHDVYNRDLITIGTGHTGGLYGDGNLTMVDGYRELNITNYGTDYYNIKDEITYDQFLLLPPREQDYYEIKYKCQQECTDNERNKYLPGASLPKDELLVLFEGQTDIIDENGNPNEAYWSQNGVVSRYAGRIMNTIQRADFCGVFGSRMVMKGARDRVVEVEDKTNYTINRVREVSLNKKVFSGSGGSSEYNTHGNYFGIYSVVNYLGALTSDLDFYNDVRTTDNKDKTKYEADANGKQYGSASFADWKTQFAMDSRRNNGKSHNQVALASGVFLELTTEESRGKTLEEKDWGPITGVVELDLINVSKGVGGGFVYAQNIHGVRCPSGKSQTLLTNLNKTGGPNGVPAATNKSWKYIETDNSANSEQKIWQTSGNFVHNTQIILDDCHNESFRYKMDDPKRKPAHKWYIKGTVYIYDRYITAHTGNPNAYTESVELPITISAASRNRMKMLDVQPNLYAYYASYSNNSSTPLTGDQKLVINDEIYELNTPISYWDWSQLPASERNLFVNETYVTSSACKVGTGATQESHSVGYVMLPDEYDRLWTLAEEKDVTPDDGINNPEKAVIKVTKDEEGNEVVVKDANGNPVYVSFNSVFHSSNNVSHDTGYLLTHKMDNPGVWNTWYTEKTGTGKNQTGGSNYEDGPTYRLNLDEDGKLLGQRYYEKTNIIPQKVYDDYNNIQSSYKPSTGQAEFVPAYVVTHECADGDQYYYPGAPVSESVGASLGTTNAAPAYVCTNSIQLSPTEYIYINDLMTEADKDALITKYTSSSDLVDAINKYVVPAYYCTTAGLYGGNYYVADNNYRALEAWSSMSEEDRANFEFNYDALDLLIDPTYGKPQGQKYQYDSKAAKLEGAQANPATYSLSTPLDYTATFEGYENAVGTTVNSLIVGTSVMVTHEGESEESSVTEIVKGDMLTHIAYESLINEQCHYAPIDVSDSQIGNDYYFYVVKKPFFHNEPYAVGQVIEKEVYDAIGDEFVDKLSFTTAGTYYYCREVYTIDANNGTPVKDVYDNTTKNKGEEVPVGFVIAQGTNDSSEYCYKNLVNQQKGFTIHGISPMEMISLYVSRGAHYDDLTKEKIITLVYQYDYEESDESGLHITPVSERHVVRIHLNFVSGIPILSDIQEPEIVLPGSSIIIRPPGILDDGVEISGSGWKLYQSKSDAESHFNGKDYVNGEPLYWYQDGFYLAYYATTFSSGTTYSNHVPVHVANYHDLKRIMDEKDNHLHVDYDRTRLKRDCKVYINDYSASGENGLDLFKDFYDLSTGKILDGHTPLNISIETGTNIYDGSTNYKGVKAGRNLEFFLRTDIDHSAPARTWTPIASGSDPCFEGILHGDGHTIRGLMPAEGTTGSLFGQLCGEVYNLGVTGSFTGGGVADTGDGYVESCWVQTSAAIPAGIKPVFGNPTASNNYVQQVVNCYYPEAPEGSEGSYYASGPATPKPAPAFYNGEVAYDLNNFYLYKRYSDKMVSAPTGSDKKVGYRYFTIGDDNKPVLQSMKYYDSNPDLCSSGYIDGSNNGLAYVEDRFEDGDFRYAAGEIPTSQDERRWVDPDDNQEYFFPIWPDDYLFFGQKLTYGHTAETHHEVPTAIVKSSGRLSQNADANRVYRAPAYYRSSKMGVAHFNPYAVFAQTKKDNAATLAYKGMTAIDFTGSNGDVAHGYQKGYDVSTPYANITGGAFYPPLLDDDGLTGFLNVDQTRNLLVYTAATGANTTAAEKTATVVSSYLNEPVYTESIEGYRKVAKQSSSDIHGIHGHWVENGTATRDHLLVDKEDFNAPISYTFAAGKRMWYQRTPDNFAGKRIENGTTVSAGWEGISLPFSAELVTTNEKGEITHFYEFSETSKNSTTKIGHEYWLRRLVDGSTMTQKTGDTNTLVAKFTYPSENDGSVVFNKTGNHAVTNTFLWDYYYSGNHQQEDKNSDIYQKYYSDSREYSKYPLLTNGTPYLIGLPGKTYYEFDLSGEWEALTTGDTKPAKLDKQTITFASVPGPETTIQVSDGEMGGNKATYSNNDYFFKPNYLNNPNLETGNNAFLLNADGSSYDEDNSSTTANVYAFRPYFTAAPVSPSRELTRSIVFLGDEDGIGPREGKEIEDLGAITARAGRHKIIVSSTRKYITDVRIVNAAGQVIATMAIKPGETIETRIINGGVYIVQDENGEYIKKLLVK